MAWRDKATPAQVGAALNMMRWCLTTGESKWAEMRLASATREEVSDELKRLRGLVIERRLDRANVFESDFWKTEEAE